MKLYGASADQADLVLAACLEASDGGRPFAASFDGQELRAVVADAGESHDDLAQYLHDVVHELPCVPKAA